MIEVNSTPPAQFTMGDPAFSASQPVHEVTLRRRFFACDREVWEDLFAQFIRDREEPLDDIPASWQAMLRGNKAPKKQRDAMQKPVWQVSWFDAVEFCNWLSASAGRQPCYRKMDDAWVCDFDANGYRLPTEAEWEFACRAGSETPWHFGNDPTWLLMYAQCRDDETRKQRQAGGLKLPNAFGLFDTYGNVAEWCWDWRAPYLQDAQTDPLGPDVGKERLLRGGGAYNNGEDECLSAARFSAPPARRYTNLGFRVVCNADPSQP